MTGQRRDVSDPRSSLSSVQNCEASADALTHRFTRQGNHPADTLGSLGWEAWR